MPLTKDAVSKRMAKTGFTLLGDYTNVRTKTMVRCPLGHEWLTLPESIMNGHGCPKCKGTCPVQCAEFFEKTIRDIGYVNLGKYSGAHSKILVRCDMGHEFYTTPSKIKTGYRCVKCAGFCPEEAEASFLLAAKNRGFVVVGKYKNSKSVVEIICPNGHHTMPIPNYFTGGGGCSECSPTSPVRAEKLFLNNAGKRGFRVVGEYHKCGTRVAMICPNGHHFSISPTSLNNGNGCDRCSGMSSGAAKELFLEELAKRGFKMIGDYGGSKIKTDIICPIGHRISVQPYSFRQGKGCAKCSRKCKKQAEESFRSIAKEEGYTVIGPYVSSVKKIEMQCNSGHIISVSAGNFKSGSRCPVCCGNRFNPSKRAVLYIFHLSRIGESALGFGISNVFKSRYTSHRSTFRKTDTTYMLLAVIEFAMGIDAFNVERLLKQHPAIIDFGIEGFRTECLPIEYKDFILKTAADAATARQLCQIPTGTPSGLAGSCI